MKSILIGSVGSSKIALQTMIELGFPLDVVFSLDEQYSKNVSGYEPIHKIAEQLGITYTTFRNINDENCISIIKQIQPDYIFVIGLSQLVGEEIIQSAKKGVIGFHPTPLPKFRGRAAIPWQILLGMEKSKASLFFIDGGMDSGPIIGQREYQIEQNDYASDVGRKCVIALEELLRIYLPKFLNNTIKAVKQDESQATYLLKRIPEDGCINWSEPVENIQCLIRATSYPYPGAYSMYKGKTKVIFWKADKLENNKYIGMPGQIAEIGENYIDVVCINGLLRIYEYSSEDTARFVVGHKFK
jgi:methionyl-tRNA formyltransferase